MFRFLGVALLPLGLLGCTSIDTIHQDISGKYVGKTAMAPIRSYGIPSREIQVAGLKAYEWEIGAGKCRMTMEVSKEDVVTDVRLTGTVPACENFNR